MRKLLIGVAVVLVLVVAAAIALPFFIPVETYKAKIADSVKSATGRDLKIDGKISFSLLPSLALEANNLAFANAPGASAKDMVTLGKLEVRLKLLPLLSGEIAVDSFVLVDPVIQLEVDKQGRPNWVFASGQSTPAAAPSRAPASGAGSSLQQVRLGDIRLANGKVVYIDQRTGQKQELNQIEMRVSLPSLDDPLAADGSLTWNAKKVTLALAVAKPRGLMEGKDSPVELKLGSDPIKFDYKGSVATTTPARVEGTIDLAIPSIRQLAEWNGHPIQMAGTGLGPLSITGKVAMEGPRFSFTDAALALDAIKGKGAIAVDTGGAKPSVKAELALDKLDLNPYLPPEAPAKAAPASGQGGQAAKPSDWSDDPIDVSGLKLANADLQLAVGGIQVRKITIGKSALKVQLKDGKLGADLTELALYDGTGQGRLAVDSNGAAPAIESTFTLAKLQVGPLLRDTMEFERLSGAGNLDFAVTSRGRSQRELVGGLNGKGSINFTNGAIKGINLGAMLRNIESAFLSSSASTPQQTDFSELSGTYTIANGILRNNDLQMLSPLFRVEGAGTVDLPKRTVNYKITPKVVASAQGQGGQTGLAGVAVPIIVEGSWDSLSYKPDLAGMVKQLGDPSKALDSLKQLVPGAAGAAAQPAPSGQAPAPASNPLNTLKGLFGTGKSN
ncbi:MAG: AsmA family protein [Proteobacteria bacterium]|nr:AsmA family protein [Pseudomonadota bacterium]